MSLQSLTGTSQEQAERGEGMLKSFSYGGDQGTSEMKEVFLSSYTMQVAIIYFFKMPLFCECMPRKLNDGQKNSVAQVKLAAFHMQWCL